jgi:hypothetical protein
MFKTKVNLKSKQAMIQFLQGHFRYYTMNSWNNATAYANNVKLRNLNIPHDKRDKAYELLESEEVFFTINDRISDFSIEHNHLWQAGFNGRSSGYIVLYQGGISYEHAHTARCNKCWKLTYHKENTPCTTDKCTGTLTVLEKPIGQVFTNPGKGIDQGEDFADWDMDSLKSRVRIVQEFDQLCVDIFMDYVNNYQLVEKDIQVNRTIKVLEHIGA